MKIGIYIFLNLTIFLLASSCVNQKRENYDYKAINELIEFLDLEPLITNGMYSRGSFNIFNDTIVGVCYAPLNRSSSEEATKFYHFRSLTDTNFNKLFKIVDLNFLDETEHYSNGYSYSRILTDKGIMAKIGVDGTIQSCFKKYDRQVVSPTTLIFWNELTIVKALNGIFIFNRENEELLWKYNYSTPTNTGGHVIIDSSFIFYDSRFPSSEPKAKGVVEGDTIYTRSTMVRSVNLNSFHVKWERIFENAETGSGGDHELQNNGKSIIAIPTSEGTYFLNTNTGKTVSKVPISFNYNYKGIQNDSAFGYINKSLVCWNISNNSLIWESPESGISFFHKDYIVGYHKDHFKIINKINGVLIKTIPINGIPPLWRVQDNYFRVDSTIYKM